MKKYLILLAGCTLLMAACSDFLELDESVYQTTKYQFSTFDRVKQSATNVYSYVQEGLLDVEGTMIDAATDVRYTPGLRAVSNAFTTGAGTVRI